MANQIQVWCEISVEAALVAGKNQHGRIQYSPSEEEIAQLLPSERIALAECCREPGHYLGCHALSVSAPEWAVIVAALRAKMDEVAAEAARRAKHMAEVEASNKDRHEKAVAASLAVTPEEIWTIVMSRGAWTVCLRDVMHVVGDERITAYLAQHEDQRLARETEAVALNQAASAKAELEEAEAAAAKIELMAWIASQNQHVGDGMAQGYAMTKAGRDFLCTWMHERIGGVWMADSSQRYDHLEMEDRESPSANALTMERELKGLELTMPPHCTVSVCGVKRVTEPVQDAGYDEPDSAVYTAVILDLQTPIGSMTGIFNSEGELPSLEELAKMAPCDGRR